jgi:hypothetical protein
MITPKKLELYLSDDGTKTVALAHGETIDAQGRRNREDPVQIENAGPEWAAFREAWGASQQSQISTLSRERDAALAAKATAESALATVAAARDAALAEVARLNAIVNPVNPPLTGSVVFERAGARFPEMIARYDDDAMLWALFFQLAAATLPLNVNEPRLAQGLAYVVQQGYATQAEIDAWFAPVTP